MPTLDHERVCALVNALSADSQHGLAQGVSSNRAVIPPILRAAAPPHAAATANYC